ncbi:MAG: hypothetical protein Q9213_006763 [Squamulea squamosa]
MDKIKNILNPGKSKDDEVMYGSGQSGDPVHTGTGSQATSSHNPSDLLSTSTAPTNPSAREPIGQGGSGSIQQGSNPLPSSHTQGTLDDDAGSAMSIKSGQPGNSQESKITGIPETHGPLDTNKALPREPTTGYTGGHDSLTTSGVGPHSSALANKADPRVDSDLDGSKGLSGHDTAGTTGGLTGSTFPDRTAGNHGDTADIGRSFPLGGASSGTTTSGPRSSDLANKADPRIDSDRDGSRGVGTTTGLGSGTGAMPSTSHQGDLSGSGLGDAPGSQTGVATGAATGVPLPKGYGPESWTHDHGKHGHEYVGDPCENEPPAPGAVHFTSGPHSLDTTNRLDPHVGGGAAGGLEHTTVDSASGTGDRHTGSGGLATGVGIGTTGVGSYESTRGTPSASTTQSAGTTAGPHKSDLLNKADPRVDSDLSKQQSTSTTSGLGGSGANSTTEPSTSRDHHGRDAALAGAGVGIGGATAYGAEKYSTRNVPEGTSGSGYSNPYPYPPNSSITEPSSSSGLGSSITKPTGSGPTSSNMDPTSTTGQTSATGLSSTTAPPQSSGLGPSQGAPTETTGLASDPSANSRDHHYGRDAGLAGAGAAVGAGTAYGANRHLGGSQGDTSTDRSLDPSTTQQPLSGASRPDYGRDAGLTGAGTTGHRDPHHQPTTASNLSGQPRSDEPSHTGEFHKGRDAALGAGAGAAAVAGGEEISRKELEREQKAAHKEELKEQKAAHKQELKEEKHHQHELEKAEKKHEKALAKEEAKHHHKEEAKHHHKDEPRKEEPQHGEKKHHGLFGFLHRDKSDKELKEEEAERKEGLEHPGSGAAGVGVAGAHPGMSEKEKHELAKEHDRNRLHKDPPPGYGQTTYAEEPKSGYASQVTGGTGTTALAQGDPVSRGSHATGLGNKADPNVTGRGDTVDSDKTRDSQGQIVEPHTGLPINVSKGDGAGGTDANPIHGYNPDGSSATGTTGGSSTEGGFGHLQDHSR